MGKLWLVLLISFHTLVSLSAENCLTRQDRQVTLVLLGESHVDPQSIKIRSLFLNKPTRYQMYSEIRQIKLPSGQIIPMAYMGREERNVTQHHTTVGLESHHYSLYSTNLFAQNLSKTQDSDINMWRNTYLSTVRNVKIRPRYRKAFDKMLSTASGTERLQLLEIKKAAQSAGNYVNANDHYATLRASDHLMTKIPIPDFKKLSWRLHQTIVRSYGQTFVPAGPNTSASRIEKMIKRSLYLRDQDFCRKLHRGICKDSRDHAIALVGYAHFDGVSRCLKRKLSQLQIRKFKTTEQTQVSSLVRYMEQLMERDEREVLVSDQSWAERAAQGQN